MFSIKVNQCTVDIDYHIAFHVSTLIATSVKVTTSQTTIDSGMKRSVGPCCIVRCHVNQISVIVTNILNGIPYQIIVLLWSIVIHTCNRPSQRLYLNTGEIQGKC